MSVTSSIVTLDTRQDLQVIQPERTLGTLALVARGRCCKEKTNVLGPLVKSESFSPRLYPRQSELPAVFLG